MDKARNYAREKQVALENTEVWLQRLVAHKEFGTIDSEVIKMAQVMLLCTLPARATTEREIVRKARLGDGSTLEITFGAGRRGVPLPYGPDRKMIAWLVDRAIRSESPVIEWSAAGEYMREVGLAAAGVNFAAVRASFRRISGLMMFYDRVSDHAVEGGHFYLIENWRLPKSIAPVSKKVVCIDGGYPFFVVFNPTLHTDMRKHHAAIPREVWLRVKGCSKVHDMFLWLYARCYQARSESIIPFQTFVDQFGSDSNPRRLLSQVKDSIQMLKRLWPGACIEERSGSIWVDRPRSLLLPDDPAKKRRTTL